jgi:signal transduction histidine kinase
MASEDRRYQSTGSGRMGNATRRGPSSVLLAPRRTASASLGNEGQAAVRQRARFASLIADLSASFVGLPVNCIDAAIEGGLRQTVEALGVDHGAFYRTTGHGLTVAHSWPAEPFEAISDTQQADNLTWIADGLRRKGVLLLSRSEVTSNETCKEEFLLRFGLKSAVLVGVMTGGSLLGALMLGSSHDEGAWTEDLEPQLQILGAIFAEALARKQNEEKLLESDRLSQAMLDSLECQIVVVNKDGRVIAGSAGRHSDAESGAPLLNDVSLGVNYFDTCRLALENGLESAAILLEGINAVVNGSREMFEMEYEYLSPSGQKFFLVSVTPRSEAGSGAVISHIETTERRLAQTSLRELSGKMITSLEEERRRIARELHDDVSQRLALMGIEMEQIIQALPRKQSNVRRRLRDLWGQNQETSLDVRRLSHNLHSSKLEYLGLVAAVKSLCNELSNHQELRIRFKHFDVPSSIPTKVALCIYRVVQESLSNVIKHSGAREVQVVLSGGHREIHLCVSDEGAGFDPDSIKAKAGIGLIGIRERLLLVGGEVSIESQPSRGTRIVARVPLPEQGQDTNVLKRQ